MNKEKNRDKRIFEIVVEIKVHRFWFSCNSFHFYFKTELLTTFLSYPGESVLEICAGTRGFIRSSAALWRESFCACFAQARVDSPHRVQAEPLSLAYILDTYYSAAPHK